MYNVLWEKVHVGMKIWDISLEMFGVSLASNGGCQEVLIHTPFCNSSWFLCYFVEIYLEKIKEVWECLILTTGVSFFLVLILSFIFLTPGVRNLFEREVDRWAALTKKLDGVILGQGKDRIWWKADSKGVFSVKSALLAITTPSHTLNTATTSLIWNWNFRVPKKVEAFLWTLFYRGTNTAEHLQKKLPYWALSPSICGMCL